MASPESPTRRPGDPDIERTFQEVRSWFETGALKAALSLGESETERIALAWLAKAGKRWRPFLAVCTYAALREDEARRLPDEIRKVAVAVECIHKASLVYDDIQDADDVRYGEPTLHREYGVPVALTAALLLLGEGYRLIADSGAPAERRAEMATLATRGHCDLCLGQGAELVWMRRPKPLSPAEVLGVFRWKTAPSFEVVFRLAAILAGAPEDVHRVLARFSEALGTAYQVKDDLDDFHGRGDVDDVFSGRPSIVLAFAHERSGEAGRKAVEEAWCRRGGAPTGPLLAAARRAIRDTGAEALAGEELARLKRSALDALRPLGNLSLKVLLARVTDKVLPGT